MSTTDRLLTSAEAMAILSIDLNTLKKRAREKGWHVVKTAGGHRRYRESEVRQTKPGKNYVVPRTRSTRT